MSRASTLAKAVGANGDIATSGNTTLGDASTDTVTFNAATASIPNGINFTNGNFGIGAASGGNALEVYRATSVASYIVGHNGSGVKTAIGVAGDNGSLLGTLTNHNLRFTTNGVHIGTFDTTGNLTLGISATSGVRLRVNNVAAVTGRTQIGYFGGASTWSVNGIEEIGVGFSGVRSTYTGADNWDLAFTTGTSAQYVAGTQVEAGRFSSGGALLLGTQTPAYSAKIVREDNANSAVQSMLVRNINSGSAASCGYLLNSYGNSWAIETGSTAKNSNALTISADPLGSPAEKIRISTGGVFTKYDANTWSYIRDHGTYTVANSYLHIKFNISKNTEKMLGFRLYGYKAYDTFIDTYFGTYLYSATSTPYGSIVKDVGSASGGAIYYGADGYLVISCATNANNYTGLRLETMVHGGDYGGGVDVQVLAYKGYATNTGAY